MMNTVFGLLLLSSAAVVAAPNTISTQHPLELKINSGLEPVCFYADQRYSKGSVIEVGKQLFVCEREKSFESNGRLSWHVFPIEPSAER